MKKILQGIVGAIASALMTWVLSLVIDRLKDVIYDKFVKKPFCVLCGGYGYRSRNTFKDDVMVHERIVCCCRQKKTKEDKNGLSTKI